MKHAEFKIGMKFRCGQPCVGQVTWLCTDVGSRTIIAIDISDSAKAAKGWFNGPPYAVAEVVFDEHDLAACEKMEV